MPLTRRAEFGAPEALCPNPQAAGKKAESVPSGLDRVDGLGFHVPKEPHTLAPDSPLRAGLEAKLIPEELVFWHLQVGSDSTSKQGS